MTDVIDDLLAQRRKRQQETGIQPTEAPPQVAATPANPVPSQTDFIDEMLAVRRRTSLPNTTLAEDTTPAEQQPGVVIPQQKPTAQDIEIDTLQNSLRRAVAANPTEEARKRELSNKLGIDAEILPADAEQRAFELDNDPAKLRHTNPAVAKFLTEYRNAAIVGKDVESLKDTEKYFNRLVIDPAITLVKGVLAANEALVGLADIATMGAAGFYFEKYLGVNYDKEREKWEARRSPEQRTLNKEVQDTRGFFPTIVAAVERPSVIAHAIGESLPSIGAGGLVSRALLAQFPKLSALVAGAVGEGTIIAGSTAEGIRQKDPDGLLDWKQLGLVGATGALGAGVGILGAKIGQKLGVGDLDTAIASGTLQNAMAKSGMQPGLIRRVLTGGAVEGAEELGQSAVEQIAQNVALEKPWDEGVPEAMAMGLITGAVMGAGTQAVTRSAPTEGLNTAVDNAAVEAAKKLISADQAQEHHGVFSELSKQAASDPLRQRAPDAFKDFVRTMAEEADTVSEVFVNAKVLEEAFNQAGITEQELKEKMPEVASDLETARDVDSDVRIPVEDYLTYIAGSKAEQPILDNLRMTPDSMTYAEAQQYYQQQEQELTEQARKLVEENQPVLTREEFDAQPVPEGEAKPTYEDYLKTHANKVEAFAMDAKQVHDRILNELNAVGRFPRSVNAVYALPFREFYAVNAAREGILPSELYARLPLNFDKMQLQGELLSQDDDDGTTGGPRKDRPGGKTAAFFKSVTTGAGGRPDGDYSTVLPLTDEQQIFADEYDRHRGHFDDHIRSSIPGFGDLQIKTGNAVVKSYPDGARVLDIGASEGSWVKAITSLSESKILTDALEPLEDMVNSFTDISRVEGSRLLAMAWGDTGWTEDNGFVVEPFKAEHKYDVIHESMTFQFITNDRAEQIQRVKDNLKEDGVALFEEKLAHDGTQVYADREAQKDQYKAQYFTAAEMAQKAKEVLVVGMNDTMVQESMLEHTLASKFKYVAKYWQASNFVGYAASDNLDALRRMVDNIGDTTSEYSNEATLKDFTPENVAGTLGKNDWAIITAELEGKSAEENAAANAQLKADLDALGVEYTDTTGRYQGEDIESKGFLVFGLDAINANKLGNKYGQDSILTRRGLVFGDMSVSPATGVKVYETREEAYAAGGYTYVPETGVVFSFDIPDFDRRLQPDSLVTNGVHFGHKRYDALKGKFAGTGLPGADNARLRWASDTRIKNYVDFYVDLGKGIKPESGLGAVRHDATLLNIYDASKNARRFKVGFTPDQFNDFESAIVDAGYDGYFVVQGEQGRVRLLGKAADAVPVLPLPEDTTLAQSAFYSALEKEIAGLIKIANKQGEAKTAQVVKWIDARQKEGKFKKEEVEAIGVLDWLKLQGDTVHVASVEEFVRANGVQVVDVMHEGTEAEFYDIRDDVEREILESVEVSQYEYDEDGEPGDPVEWTVNYGNVTYTVDVDPYNMTQDELLGLVGYEDTSPRGTAFERFTLPGGQDYKELALVLPGDVRYNVPDAHAMSEEADVNRIAHIRFNERRIRMAPTAEMLAERAAYEAAVDALEAEAAPFLQEKKESAQAYEAAANAVWDRVRAEVAAEVEAGRIPAERVNAEISNRALEAVKADDEVRALAERNRIASDKVREIADRYPKKPRWMVDGTPIERVLFIEEIQSDWAQEGRREGFAAPVPQFHIAYKDGPTIGSAYDSQTEAEDALTRIFNNRTDLEIREVSAVVKGVQPAPFVTDTKAWVALSLKRMMRYAAENGFDRIAWTTGEQQAERYNLSKRVRITYGPREGGANMWVLATETGTDRTVFEREVPVSELPDVVGKDVADKMLQKEGVAEDTHSMRIIKTRGEPTGVFERGGDWFIQFASEEMGTYPSRESAERSAEFIRDMVTREPNRVLEGDDLRVGGEGMRAFYDGIVPQVANTLLKKLKGGKVEAIDMRGTRIGEITPDEIGVQHTFAITPELRDAVMRGLPLFQRRAAFNPSTLTVSLLKGSDLSSVIHEGGHFYLEALANMAEQPNAPQQIKDDFRKTLDWFGIKPGAQQVTTAGGAPGVLEQRAFHGSPYTFDRFSTSKIGTGEGAQAYGFGLYFTDKREIAEWYKNTTEAARGAKLIDRTGGEIPKEVGANPSAFAQWALVTSGGDYQRAITEISGYLGMFDDDSMYREAVNVLNRYRDEGVVLRAEPGRLYEVELAPSEDEYLLWDKPLNQQSEKVQKAIREYASLNPGSSISDMVSPLEAGVSTGTAMYSTLTRELGTDRLASDALHSLGVRGVKYPAGEQQTPGKVDYNYVIFSDLDVEIINVFNQGGQVPPAGQLPPGNTPEEIWANMTLEQKRPYHELWAQSWERYALEGKAPTSEMQPVFARFRAWMLSIYKSIKEFLRQNPLAGRLNDDIRAVFDRLIASEEAINETEKMRGYAALFSSAEQAGVTLKQFQEYLELGEAATLKAYDEMMTRSLKDMKWLSGARNRAIRALQVEADRKRRAIREEVTEEVMIEPVNRARTFFRTGKLMDDRGNEVDTNVVAKLNAAEVKELRPGLNLGTASIRGMTSEDGISLALAAQMFGFDSGEALIDAITKEESAEDKIKGLTDQRMLERNGDLVDDRAIQAAADEAVHNEARARFMATGLKMLSKSPIPARELAKAANEAARNTIARKKVRELAPGKYTTAEAKANAQAIKLAASDPQGAITAQRAALLNNRLAKASLDAQREIERILKYVNKFKNAGTRKGLDIDYLEQIDDLVQAFDTRKGVSLKQLEKRRSLADWIDEQEANGFEPAIDADLIEDLKRQHYKDMTLEELRGLHDTIKQIEHLGRLKKKLLTARDERDLQKRVEEATQSITDNAHGRKVKERGTPTDVIGITAQWFRKMAASHRKFNSIIRQMDGGTDGGVMWELLARGMNEAGDMETERKGLAAEAIAKLFKELPKDKVVPGNLYARKRKIPGTDFSMTQEQRIMFALNWGNAGNRQRLLDGGITGKRALSEAEAQKVLDTLTKQEWDFVQGVWDYITTYKDEIAALERKLTGVEPTWVEATPVITKFGTYKGGYFPAKYDTELSSRSESLEAVTDLRMGMKGAFQSAATKSGYTKARANQVINRPLLLSYNVISQHVNEVVHRLSWQPWLTDANRLLKALDLPIREHYGPEILRELRETVNDIAMGDAPAKNPTEQAINRLRTGSTIVGMGWKFTTAALQLTGHTQSIARIGTGWWGKGFAQYMANPNAAGRLVDEKSSLMRNRNKTMYREINEVLNTVRAGEGVSNLTASFFYLIGKMQRTVDVPTWLGAYEKGLAQNKYENATTEAQRKEIEDKAVAMADQAVLDAQSGGQIKDLARVQRGSPVFKLFTNFYSYFSATYNLNVEAIRRTNFKSPTQVAILAADLILLNVMPVVLGFALGNAIKGECDWDDYECVTKKLIQDQLSFLFGQMILLRELAAGVTALVGGTQYGYQGPAGLRFFSDVYKSSVQVGQGEVDMPLFKSVNNVAGAILHYPAGQINATVEGIMAVEDGRVEGAAILPAILFGPPKD